ncbi:hypothetical protein G6F61_011933 [Rhizopus arrhizus]|nr:hypothetical protein G6F61_011933 [Rhizopus arrhizus]
MEPNRHFYLKQIQKGLYVDVENNSVDVDAYIVLKDKTNNDWEGKQVWYFDEKEQIVNVQSGKVIGFLNRDPNTSNHFTLVQKENQQNPEFQWWYEEERMIIYSKKLGPAYNLGPHAGNAFDGAKMCMEQGNPVPGPQELFEIIYK